MLTAEAEKILNENPVELLIRKKPSHKTGGRQIWIYEVTFMDDISNCYCGSATRLGVAMRKAVDQFNSKIVGIFDGESKQDVSGDTGDGNDESGGIATDVRRSYPAFTTRSLYRKKADASY